MAKASCVLAAILVGGLPLLSASGADDGCDSCPDAKVLVLAADAVNSNSVATPEPPGPVIWKDASQTIDARVRDLVGRMTLAEKVEQMRNSAPAISRLGVPAYDYWNECLHGVARAGIATVFPQAIGMAATWDVPLVHEEADVIATEARAKDNDYRSQHDGNSARYFGLTFWTPNINIFRDPRWGRGQETYGEDTFLTSRLAVSFIRGLQGDDPKYVKAMACAKHFVVHSGPESERHRFDAEPSERDFYDTYLPHFEAAVREGHVGAVMGAYNSVYGKPACANPFLLTTLLRERWGFTGHVVSDCGAIHDIFAHHKYTKTPEEAAALAVKAGDDLCCGQDYNALVQAVQQNLISESQINDALGRVLTARFRLGLFDPPEMVPYARIPFSENDSAAHRDLALKVARESIVLLKNDGLLPLDRKKIRHIVVVGVNAVSVEMLLGNYKGEPSSAIPVLDGVADVAGPDIKVDYEPGCPLALRADKSAKVDPEYLDEAVQAAKSADVVIYVGGINSELEGEQMRVNYEGFDGGDRTRIELPEPQTKMLKLLQATGKPVVFVNCSGSAIAMPWEAEHLPAIVQAWYPGEEGGRAVAEVLFGTVNPAGRLPVTFYRSTDDLPAFDNYSMANRTYRYFNGKPLFAFGHGLSYTHFDYRQAKLKNETVDANGTITLSFDLANTGKAAGDEVAQVYFRQAHSSAEQPRLALCGFQRVHLQQGKRETVRFEIPAARFRHWDTSEKQYVVEPGDYELLIGAASDDIRLRTPFKVSSN
ncbi:MAG TPA: glycoside hydrolase family 3 C-terminal domain-containing protein [Verrucomicrobiae bacterium]|jgi:beta-glucosidase|nr:glycoside hydrolase family 3 C-terminal domain-containing protein [Verrucomicrobiae bacterium]